MTDREKELVVKTTRILGKDTSHMNLVDIIAELTELIDRKRNVQERPEWFTKEYYLQLKKNGINDQDIYEQILFVSLPTFVRFKKEIDAAGVSNKGGHNRKINYEQAENLYNNGFPLADIAERYGTTTKSILRAIKIQRERMKKL